MDKILITKNEIAEWVSIDEKISTERINTTIRNVQHKRLRPLLGEAMYYDFITKIATNSPTSAYTNLLAGTTYTYQGKTIRYYGLKPYLACYTLSEIAIKGNFHMSRKGMLEFSDENFMRVPSTSKLTMQSQEFAVDAAGYENGIIKFLQTNSGDYPLWESKAKKDITRFKFNIIN